MSDITPRPLYHREREPVPAVQEAGAENLAPSGVRSSDRAANKSRYTNCAIQAHTDVSPLHKNKNLIIYI